MRMVHTVLQALALSALATVATAAAPNDRTGDSTVNAVKESSDGARDFDFWMGSWKVHSKRLRERLHGSTQWDEFEATSVARPLLGGIGNEDEFRGDFNGPFIGMSFRFYDLAKRTWAIYWADSRRGVLEPPVYGSFSGGVGHFEGDDVFEGLPIRVRFLWTRVDTPNPRWEQAFSTDGGRTWETNWIMDMTRADAQQSPAASALANGDSIAHLKDYSVIELRRYTIKPGEREHFARYFESYFPEAFEQLGAMVFGQFLERDKDDMFVWLRGFRDMDARAVVNSSFYYGPLWKEHRTTMNDRLIDSDDVLLLRPLDAAHAVPVFPTVDPVNELAGARGAVVAEIFAVKPGQVEALAQRAAPVFAGYRAAGARELGVLVTLDAKNNFPQLPVREDGPYIVWLGLFKDDAALKRGLAGLADATSRSPLAGLLRDKPELVVLNPTARSRLRWRD